ncbi:MAG TPA: tRNA pseudouridine(55) synthase TruB [Acidimicrobiales bacterium]|nr:tRNA pseudouridine(55) synthase TruB [Acidimicrobiales bacterium]
MIDGLVVVDKASGWTSHDVVARCRRLLGQRRVGHAGTLDPDATGVLAVGLGRATRLLRFVGALPKAYRGEVVLGVATSTLDAAGEVTARFDMGGISLEEVRAAAADLTGEIHQVPPMVSARRVGGRRLHELARAGVVVEREARAVVVDRLEVTPTEEEGVVTIEVRCSSGTYVRTLAADLGEALGGGAHLRSLRRLAVGSFTEDEAVAVEQVAPDRVLTPAQGLRDLPAAAVPPEVAAAVAHGAVLAPADLDLGAAEEGPVAVLDGTGALLAVYEAVQGRGAGGGDPRLKPAVVLAAAVGRPR